ncbi:MAG: transporter [Cyclobacteriaceae bacterium]|nr:transporter [Cyclobacteriaceae bacterium]
MRFNVLLVLLLSSWGLYGQYGETIRSGRPGQAIGAFTVGKNVLQVQSGITFGWLEFEESGSEINSINPSVVIRFGIAERIEISGVVGYSSLEEKFSSEVDKYGGISAAQIGVRFNLRDGQGSGPNIGIQSRLRLNVLSDDFNQENLGNTTILSVTQGLGPKFGLATNLGVTWIGNGSNPLGTYVLNFGYDVSAKVSVFVENYGVMNNSDINTRFDTGLGYLVNPNLKLDFSVGYGNNQDLEDYFFDIGFSWRTLAKPR